MDEDQRIKKASEDGSDADAFMETNNSETTIHERAEFISATVIRPNRKTDLGLTLCTEARRLEIASIDPIGLLASSPLQLGDRIISID